MRSWAGLPAVRQRRPVAPGSWCAISWIAAATVRLPGSLRPVAVGARGATVGSSWAGGNDCLHRQRDCGGGRPADRRQCPHRAQSYSERRARACRARPASAWLHRLQQWQPHQRPEWLCCRRQCHQQHDQRDAIEVSGGGMGLRSAISSPVVCRCGWFISGLGASVGTRWR